MSVWDITQKTCLLCSEGTTMGVNMEGLVEGESLLLPPALLARTVVAVDCRVETCKPRSEGIKRRGKEGSQDRETDPATQLAHPSLQQRECLTEGKS